jgi:hypothetical protein
VPVGFRLPLLLSDRDINVSGKVCYWVGEFEAVVWEDGAHGRVCHELMANGSKRVVQGRRHDFAITCRADLSES